MDCPLVYLALRPRLVVPGNCHIPSSKSKIENTVVCSICNTDIYTFLCYTKCRETSSHTRLINSSRGHSSRVQYIAFSSTYFSLPFLSESFYSSQRTMSKAKKARLSDRSSGEFFPGRTITVRSRTKTIEGLTLELII